MIPAPRGWPTNDSGDDRPQRSGRPALPAHLRTLPRPAASNPPSSREPQDLRKRCASRPAAGSRLHHRSRSSSRAGGRGHPLLTDRRSTGGPRRRGVPQPVRSSRREGAGDRYGCAKHLRDGLPNASFIGLTGTPIAKEDVSARAVFGDYIQRLRHPPGRRGWRNGPDLLLEPARQLGLNVPRRPKIGPRG
ncbi:hypothetical protein [Tessaracoccus sp.]|uniref:hypothetical protein n=1 Tax=Tessaracoccus sp. TaxID=1971211 RepID=UPI00344F9068